MYFFIADISGYTAFMLATKREVGHGMLIITELMNELVKQVRVPLAIAKLEGDALFVYMKEEDAVKNIPDIKAFLGEKIPEFFKIFSNKVVELQNGVLCTCGACSNIEKLNLKMIAHYGSAAIDKIGQFDELSGLDVILVHRLLKNKIKENRYLLLTEQIYQKLALPADAVVVKREESDKDFGLIPIYIYYPPGAEPVKASLIEKIGVTGKFFCSVLAYKLGLIKKRKFDNLPSNKHLFKN